MKLGLMNNHYKKQKINMNFKKTKEEIYDATLTNLRTVEFVSVCFKLDFENNN